ncbi:MAG: hypothetical protein GYB36_09530 [Alphaproteobacteria bacterium]|nr:hypothetical protein [Alphaproteobacteria bacterium]
MKTFLLGGVAALAVGVAAFAADGDADRTRIHLAAGSQIHMSDGHGTVVEVRGSEGSRTVHIANSSDESRLEINGRVIEIDGGEVIVDGEEVANGYGTMVIVDGDDVQVIESDSHAGFEARHFAHMTERAEHAARMGEELARHTMINIDLEGLEEDIMSTLAEAFEDLPDDLEGHYYNDGRRWDDLSPREQEEVREALEEAREEIQQAMRDVRIEIREAARDAEAARHVEVRVARDMARAEREIARAERDAERAARHAERDHRRREIRERYEYESDRDVDTLRIETEDGRRRIWVNGEEQTGDDLTEWLNRLESGRLEGGN